MIAHRLSTVANADKIFVLSDGKLAEEGKFDSCVNAADFSALCGTNIKKPFAGKCQRRHKL